MVVMEVDKFKCLICEVSFPHKGLAFFKFPKEEFRLKMWIKEISPLLDILNIQPTSLKKNGRICARHFRQKDFINCKQNSLVQNACPSLSVSNLNLNFQKNTLLKEECFSKGSSSEEQSSDGSETDILQCGRCKTQFEILSEFIDHKRSRCQPMSTKLLQNIKKTTDFSSQLILLPSESSRTKNLEKQSSEALYPGSENSSGQVIKILNPGSATDDEVVSLNTDGNNLMVGSPFEVSTRPTQVILTPQLPLSYNSVVVGDSIDLSFSGHVILTSQTSKGNSLLLHNAEPGDQAKNLILTCNDSSSSNNGIIYPCLVKNNELVLTSEIIANQNTLKNEVSSPSEGIEDSDQMLTFCKLTNVIVESQHTSFIQNYPKKETKERERSNQTGENELGKPKTKLSCSYCGKIFEKSFNLQQHERIHTGERPFQCIVCGRAFTQKSNVRKHMMRHRVWPKGKQTLKLRRGGQEGASSELLSEMNYSCQYCTLSFKSYPEHKKHLSVHSNIKVYRCIQKGCYETFSDLDEFLSHSKRHSSAEFQCHICLKAFNNLEDLGVHQYDHDKTAREKLKEEGIKLKCKVCHARFKTMESLKNHLAVDAHNHECVHCKSVFCSERFLRRHLFIHMDSSQLKFKCQNCKKPFRTQQNLKNHLFIHLKEKPFTCDHCEKQFASKYRLKRHVAIHLSEYFDCPFKEHLGCNKTFYRKDKLKDHINTHNHCEVSSCRICAKVYWTMSKSNQKRNRKKGKRERGVLRCFSDSQTSRKQKRIPNQHCSVKEKSRNLEAVKNENNDLKAVSNIEIIMVPFGAREEQIS